MKEIMKVMKDIMKEIKHTVSNNIRYNPNVQLSLFRVLYSILLRIPLLGLDHSLISVLGIELLSTSTNEIEVGTNIMVNYEAAEAFNNGNYYVIPTQEIERQLPGDFYHLTENKIISVTEFKYISKECSILPTNMELLYKNLYHSHSTLMIGT